MTIQNKKKGWPYGTPKRETYLLHALECLLEGLNLVIANAHLRLEICLDQVHLILVGLHLAPQAVILLLRTLVVFIDR